MYVVSIQYTFETGCAHVVTYQHTKNMFSYFGIEIDTLQIKCQHLPLLRSGVEVENRMVYK